MKYLSRLFLIVFLFSLYGLCTIKAQNNSEERVHGKVVDVDEKPISGVAVFMFTTDSVYVDGCMSLEDGTFELKKSLSEFRLTFKHLTYMQHSQLYNTKNVGNVVMKENSNMLKEVEVKAYKPLVKAENGILKYDVEQIVKYEAVSNAYDVLKKVPLINVENNQISLLGASSMTLIVNGKRSTMSLEQISTYLNSLPAERVGSVEIMYTPHPKYGVRGAVVNVVLKKSKDNSLVGEAHGGYSYTSKNSVNAGGNLLYNKKNTTVDFLYEVSRNNSISEMELDSKHKVGSTVTEILHTDHNNISSFNNYARLGLNHIFNNGHEIDATYSFSLRPFSDADYTSVSNLFNNHTDMHSNDAYHNINIDYKTKNSWQFNLEYMHYRKNKDQEVTDIIDNTNNFKIDEKQRINTSVFSLNKDLKINNSFSLSLGGMSKLSFSDDSQVYNYKVKTSQNSQAENFNRELSTNAYVGVNKMFRNGMSLTASLTGEFYKKGDITRFMPYPRLEFGYMKNPTKYIFQMSMSGETIYPAFWTMGKRKTTLGNYMDIYGNPELTPMSLYDISFRNIFKQRYIMQLSINYRKNAFEQSAFQSRDELKMMYQTFNWNHKSSIELLFVAPFNVSNVWTGRVLLQGCYNSVKKDNFYGLKVNRDNWRFFTMVANNIRLSKKPAISLDIDARYLTPSIQTTYNLNSILVLNAGLKCSLMNNNLVITARGSDLFNKGMPRVSSAIEGQNFSFYNGKYKRTFSINVSYKFGAYKKRSHKAIDTSRLGN